MQTRIFDLLRNKNIYATGINGNLSFNKYIHHLTTLLNHASPGKQNLLKYMLDKFIQAEKQHGPLNKSNIEKFSSELYLIYTLMVPLLQNEEQILWGLSAPLSGEIFYGTDNFYDFIENEAMHNHFDEVSIQGQSKEDIQLHFIYTLIFERLYGFPLINSEPLVYMIKDHKNGLPKYFEIQIDNTFVDVKHNGVLPQIDYESLKSRGIQNLKLSELVTVLPLDSFTIEGFSVITLQDNGHIQVVEQIKNMIINLPDSDLSLDRSEFEQSLQILTENPYLHFGLTPLFKLNGSPVMEPQMASNSILFNHLISKNDGSPVISLVNEYLEKPYTIAYNIFSEVDDSYSRLVKEIIKLDITSYVCIPLTYNNKVVGLLEIHSDVKDYIIDKLDIAKLRYITPLLAQFANYQINEFNTKLDSIIKNKFTGIQQSVHWKFKKAAWRYLLDSRTQGTKIPMSDIQFNNVHPLYGSIDIVESTYRRNKAQYLDLKIQLQLLTETLEKIWEFSQWTDAQNFLQKSVEWQNKLSIDQIDSFQIVIENFLQIEIPELFDKSKTQYPALIPYIRKYEIETDAEKGFCYSQRRAFESSLKQINQTIASFLDSLNAEIQICYPSYFEKFRTDGIEYDIYVGQSIEPEIRFTDTHLDRIQYLQLLNMISIVKATHNLKPELVVKMDTTQLIFVNSSSIDINFRVDERRFDVEGSYNVRYHLIKKRIDKVLIKNTDERLTKPGTISLVFHHENSVKNYYIIMKEMLRIGLLINEIEKLELQELQGVNGLKALRVTVNLNF